MGQFATVFVAAAGAAASVAVFGLSFPSISSAASCIHSLIFFPVSVSPPISLIAFSPIAPNNNPPIVFINPNFQIHPTTRASDVHGYLDIADIGFDMNFSMVNSHFGSFVAISSFSF